MPSQRRAAACDIATTQGLSSTYPVISTDDDHRRKWNGFCEIESDPVYQAAMCEIQDNGLPDAGIFQCNAV